MNRRPSADEATLVPVNLDDPKQMGIMLAQRKICGWGSDSVPTWHKHIKSGDRAMFWIAFPASCVPDPTKSDALDFVTFSAGGEERTYLLVGHTALDRIDLPSDFYLRSDDTLTAADGSVLTISSLFVMPQFKSSGLGSWSMRELEKFAQEEPYGSPACVALTINTLAPRHCKGGLPGPYGMGIWDASGLPVQERCSNTWYEKMGYVQYKEDQRYRAEPVDGVPNYAWVVFLRKELPPRK